LYLGLSVAFLILISGFAITSLSSVIFAQDTFIPNWIRDTALWWGEGKISDTDYINSLQWLIDKEILKIPILEENGDKIDKEVDFDKISFEVAGIEELIENSDIRQALIDSNSKFAKFEDPYSMIEQKDNEWTAKDFEELTPFMTELIENEISDQLRAHAIKYKESLGYDVYPEIFVTNSFGANIAQTGKTSDYKQNDEIWWIRAQHDKLYISEIHYDESADVYSADISLRIDDERGGFLGVIKAVTNVDQIFN